MTRTLSILFLLLGFSAHLNAQKASDPVLSDSFNAELLRLLVHTKVDSVRHKRRAGATSVDKVLQKAAQDHADYLLPRKKLTHNQRGKKKTPADRVAFYGGATDLIGENVLFTYFGKPVQPIKGGRTYTNRTYDELALAMVKQWVKSPPHYKTMKNKGYKTTGIGISVDKISRRVIAVQVFGGTMK